MFIDDKLVCKCHSCYFVRFFSSSSFFVFSSFSPFPLSLPILFLLLSFPSLLLIIQFLLPLVALFSNFLYLPLPTSRSWVSPSHNPSSSLECHMSLAQSFPITCLPSLTNQTISHFSSAICFSHDPFPFLECNLFLAQLFPYLSFHLFLTQPFPCLSSFPSLAQSFPISQCHLFLAQLSLLIYLPFSQGSS